MKTLMDRLAQDSPFTAFNNTAANTVADLADGASELTDHVLDQNVRLRLAHERFVGRSQSRSLTPESNAGR